MGNKMFKSKFISQNILALLRGGQNGPKNSSVVIDLFSKSHANTLKTHRLERSVKTEMAKLKNVFSRIERGRQVQIVACPSISLKREDVENIKGIDFYEMRSLWQILYATKENINVLYLSSNPVETENVKHLLSCVGVTDEIKKRIQFFDLCDSQHQGPLSEKVMKSDKALQAIRNSIIRNASFLMPFTYSESEKKLAESLGIPVFGCHPDLHYWQTKSGNKVVFNRAQIPHPDGQEDLKSKEDILFALMNTWRRNPEVQIFLVKLDSGVSGEGNAKIQFDTAFETFESWTLSEKLSYLESKLEQMKFQNQSITLESFLERFRAGGIVEVFLSGEDFYSPSAQGYITPRSEVRLLSTHNQILDESGMKYLGCVFPAGNDIRDSLSTYTKKIGQELAKEGIIGFFSVDFIVYKRDGKRHIKVIEVNIRQGGTTHPYQTTKLMTESKYDEDQGVLVDKNGRAVYYNANDNFCRDEFKGKCPGDLLSYLSKHNIIFNKEKSSGAVFHMLNSFGVYGKLGYTVIGGSKDEVNRIQRDLEELLNQY
ncbi:MAG: hypothetical protein ACPGJV_05950 [Bacteriovoracaceae bacterium]